MNPQISADQLFAEAIRLHHADRLAEAEGLYREVLTAAPLHAACHCNYGVIQIGFGRLDAAIASLDAAILAMPDLLEAHVNRGNALKELGRLDEAFASYHRALRIKPDAASAHVNRGNVLKMLGRREDTLASYTAALCLAPGSAEVLSNRGSALEDLDRYQDALTSYDRALLIRPDLAEAHSNRGSTLQDLGRHEDALASYGAAIAIKPDLARARYNRALAWLLLGDMAKGWHEHEWRWRGGHKGLKPRGFSQPLWDGGDIAGRTILLHAEQGLGDTLQFCRYAKLVAGRGARVILETPRPLLGLFSGLEGVDRIIAAGEPLPDFDFHCPLMSLPLVFGTRMETIPPSLELTVDPEQVERWRQRLDPSLFHVGVMWRGNPNFKNDRNRSVGPGLVRRLCTQAPEGVSFLSLQKEQTGEEAAMLGGNVHFFDTSNLADTAALISALDLVISVDTAISHLAGALGRPTWIALPSMPDWRWMLGRDDSPWYPSVRLFRQAAVGDWEPVFDRMAAELTQRLSTNP